MNAHRLFSSCMAVAMTGGLAASAHAEPLVFNNVPVASAASQLSAKYGIDIEIGSLARTQVTFVIDDANAPGARLEAVSALANAAKADFTKTYIISRVADGNMQSGQVDTSSPLPSQQTTYSVPEAIAMVAGMDDAAVQTAGSISGNVTLSASSLTVAQAAAEIARQTKTRWQTVYTLAPRFSGRLTGGTVIGHTSGGSPIVQLAYIYYHDAQWNAHEKLVEEDERQQAIAAQQALAAQQAADAQQAAALSQQNEAIRASAAYQSMSGNGNSSNGPIVFGDQSYGN